MIPARSVIRIAPTPIPQTGRFEGVPRPSAHRSSAHWSSRVVLGRTDVGDRARSLPASRHCSQSRWWLAVATSTAFVTAFGRSRRLGAPSARGVSLSVRSRRCATATATLCTQPAVATSPRSAPARTQRDRRRPTRLIGLAAPSVHERVQPISGIGGTTWTASSGLRQERRRPEPRRRAYWAGARQRHPGAGAPRGPGPRL